MIKLYGQTAEKLKSLPYDLQYINIKLNFPTLPLLTSTHTFKDINYRTPITEREKNNCRALFLKKEKHLSKYSYTAPKRNQRKH